MDERLQQISESFTQPVKSYRDIDFLKPESLNTLKRWLYNHEGKRKGPAGWRYFVLVLEKLK